MKNKIKYFIFLLPAVSYLLYSCYTPRYVYSPSAHNVPVLAKKNDSKLAGNYSTNLSVSNNSGGIDLQGAYAFTNHLAFSANYSKRWEDNKGEFNTSSIYDSAVINYRRNLTEFGIGYFHPLNDSKTAMFQIFGGVGFGKFRFTDNGRDRNNNLYRRFHEASITKVYLQPAILLSSKRNFAASFSGRISGITFKKIKTDYTAEELGKYKLDSISYRTRLFWEPCIINTFGYKKLPGIQFEFQLGFSFLFSKTFIDYRFLNASAGILFDIPKMGIKKDKSSKGE